MIASMYNYKNLLNALGWLLGCTAVFVLLSTLPLMTWTKACLVIALGLWGCALALVQPGWPSRLFAVSAIATSLAALGHLDHALNATLLAIGHLLIWL